MDSYLDALEKELDYVAVKFGKKHLNSIYIGGGTPTTLEPYQLDRLIRKIRCSFDLSHCLEFTVEAGRPDSITREKLETLKKWDITRISINPQTMKDETLKIIGRRHTVAQTVESFQLARELGFDDINMDLIMGLPEESLEDVRDTLEQVKALKPDNLTVHSLALKRAARLNMFKEDYKDYKMVNTTEHMNLTAEYAKEMGLDGIYLHGHEGYLLEQMTNPAFNRRQMGRYKDYEMFGLDIIREIRKRAGDSFPIMYRIDLSLALNETYQERMNEVSSLKRFKNGRTIKDTLHYMAKLVRAGVDLFDVDLGCYDNWWLPHPPEGMPAGCFLDMSKIAKEFFRRNRIKSNTGVDVPVVAVGKLGYPDIAEKAIRDGDCDMVMLARPLLADPDWCNKAFAGNVEEIRPCIGCQEGCVNEFILGGHPQCAVNPRTGFEERFPETFTPAEKKKNIAVVGGGPAGITFALIAAKRGHNVTLYEKSEKLGGKIAVGSIPKIKFDLRNYLAYLEKQVELCQEQYQLQVHKNTTVTAELLKEKAYDSVIFAYGTKEIFPPFEGREEANLILGTDLLEHPEKAEGANNIVIVGGGVVGCETAHWLANEYGKNVTVLEMLPHFMMGVCTANRGHLLHYLEKSGVRLYNCTKVKALAKDGVYVEQNQSQTVPDPYNTWQPLLPPNIPNPMEKAIKEEIVEKKIPADLIVLAMGGKADETFFFEAGEEHLAKEIYNIGDSSRAGRVLEAVRGAYHLAVRI